MNAHTPPQFVARDTLAALPYNTTRQQRERILIRLRRGPATRLELEQEQNVPDATARIHELRKQGHDIRTDIVTLIYRDGTASKVARYWLSGGESSQGDLFAKLPCATN